MSDHWPLPPPARAALDAWGARLRHTAPGHEPLVVAWAPGRVNLIGEHTDYNEGWVLPAAVDHYVALAGRRARTPFVTLYSTHHSGRARFPSDTKSLRANRGGRLPLWARFVRATLAEIGKAGHWGDDVGFTSAIAGDVPVGGGLSSSAALAVGCATYALALQGQSMAPLDIARACQQAEWSATGVRVGIMDQAASALGQANNALLLDCRSLDYTYVPMDLPGVRLFVFDTGVPHTLATSGYNERRAQCEEAVSRLAAMIAVLAPSRSVMALRDVTPEDLDRFGPRLPELLLWRARHVVAENARTLEAVGALRAGDLVRLGALINQSHQSLRDLYQVSCAELDAAAEILRAVPGVFGARMMGAGFGGSVLALLRNDAVNAAKAALAREYTAMTGRQGRGYVLRIGGGPRWRALELDRSRNPAL